MIRTNSGALPDKSVCSSRVPRALARSRATRLARKKLLTMDGMFSVGSQDQAECPAGMASIDRRSVCHILRGEIRIVEEAMFQILKENECHRSLRR